MTAVIHAILTRDRQLRSGMTKDPRLASMAETMAFYVKRMAYGGFRILVDA